MSDWRLRLFPSGKREWGEALLAEFGDEARLGRLILQAWWLTIEKGDHMKTVVTTTSAVNVLFGSFMAGLFLHNGPNPPLVLITAGCMMIQGGYTLWYVANESRRLEPWSSRLLLAGQTCALLVGVGGFVEAVLNSAGASVDPEYGPVAVAGLITAQAAAALYCYAIRGRAVRLDATDPS